MFPKLELEMVGDKQVLIVTKIESSPSRAEEIIEILNRGRRSVK